MSNENDEQYEEDNILSVSYAYITGVIEPQDEDDPREMRMIWHPPTDDGEPHACGHSMGWAHPVFIDTRSGVAMAAPDDIEMPPEVLMALDAALLDIRNGIDQSLTHELEDRG